MSAFRKNNHVAWTFHNNTVRWPHNTLQPADEPCEQPSFKEYLRSPTHALPLSAPAPMPLAEAIATRLSCRRFSSDPVKVAELSALLKAAYGVQGVVSIGAAEHHERPVPSGGGLYPLEIYLLARRVESVASGVYHYAALSHILEEVRVLPLPDALVSQLFMGQTYLENAAAIFVITAVFERSLFKYGDRGYRYILFEAGHVAQNINLTAITLGLGSFNLGGFFDVYLAELLGLDLEEEAPIYGVALGIPGSSDRVEQRVVEGLWEA